MDLLPSLSWANREKFLLNSTQEILFFFPTIEACKPYSELLIKKAKSGIRIKILIRSFSDQNNPFFAALKSANIEIKSIHFFRRAPESNREVCIVDSALALIGQPMLAENPVIILREEEVSAVADYFHHYWLKMKPFAEKLSYFVRHNKFSFTIGRGCFHALQGAIQSAESEIFVAMPRISKRMTKALLSARNRGVKVTLVTSSLKSSRFSRLRWFIRIRLLESAGVSVLSVPHRALDFVALIDKKIVFFGSSQRGLLGENNIESAFGIFDNEICQQYAEILKENLTPPSAF